MKQIIILIQLSLLLIATAEAQIISQYVETELGTSPKGIEIWNNTNSTLNFATNNLVIKKGTNGGTANADYTLSSGTLAPGAVIVIGTSDMETKSTAQGATYYAKSFTFNGDDALVVEYGGTITDMFGLEGTDPGSSWEASGVSTRNSNIELNFGLISGDADGCSYLPVACCGRCGTAPAENS